MNEFQESIRNHLNDAEGLRIFAKELVNRAFLAGLWEPEKERSKMIEDAVEQLFKEIKEVSGGSVTVREEMQGVGCDTDKNPIRKATEINTAPQDSREPPQNQDKREGEPK